MGKNRTLHTWMIHTKMKMDISYKIRIKMSIKSLISFLYKMEMSHLTSGKTNPILFVDERFDTIYVLVRNIQFYFSL